MQLNLEQMAGMSMELRQMNVKLIRQVTAITAEQDPTGILRAAMNETGKRCIEAAVALAGTAALVDQVKQ